MQPPPGTPALVYADPEGYVRVFYVANVAGGRQETSTLLIPVTAADTVETLQERAEEEALVRSSDTPTFAGLERLTIVPSLPIV